METPLLVATIHHRAQLRGRARSLSRRVLQRFVFPSLGDQVIKEYNIFAIGHRELLNHESVDPYPMTR